MLQQPDRADFIEAIYKEVKHILTMLYGRKYPRRKRHADGSLSKHKARLCCHGGQQQWGVNFYETYAPVVA
eukprot:81343-Ditylum_brightwellii.AAC.2